MKNATLNELEDDILDHISGGTDDPRFCPKCGNPLTANNFCAVCNVLIPINPRENG